MIPEKAQGIISLLYYHFDMRKKNYLCYGINIYRSEKSVEIFMVVMNKFIEVRNA